MLSILLWLLTTVSSMAPTDAAAAHTAANINHAYRITGDPLVAPIQAFDDGTNLYLQLRDVNRPPAPFSRDGAPASYDLRPPYMVLPLQDKVELHYGQRQAQVEAATRKAEPGTPQGAPGGNLWYGAARPGRVTGNASEPKEAAAAMTKPDRPIEAAKVVESPIPMEPQKPSVSGEFEVKHKEAVVPAPPVRVIAAQQPIAKPIEISVSVEEPLDAETRAKVSRMALVPGANLQVSADGTLKGYRKAREIAAHVERVAGTKPHVDDAGAPTGKVVVKGIL